MFHTMAIDFTLDMPALFFSHKTGARDDSEDWQGFAEGQWTYAFFERSEAILS